MNRIPVVSKDKKPLMPTKPSRARKWVESGRAVGKWADVDLTSGRKGTRSGKGFSPVTIGQKFCISELEKIAPVYVREGWQKDGNGTSQLRTALGLVKDKQNKSEAKPETQSCFPI